MNRSSHIKKLLWLFLLLHVSAAQANIGSALLWPLRAFYRGPYTSCLSKLSSLPKTTVPLSREHTQEVIDVLEEMQVPPSNVKLLIKKDAEPDCSDKCRKAGIFEPRSSAHTIGSSLVFDHDFFAAIPKAQRRAIIGREAWHIKRMDDFKIVFSAPLLSLAIGLGTAVFISNCLPTYEVYRGGKFIRSEHDFITPMYAGAFFGLFSLIGTPNAIRRKHLEEADIRSATMLRCVLDTIAYYDAQRQDNLRRKEALPERFVIAEDGSITSADPENITDSLARDEVYDNSGNYRYDPSLTSRLLSLRLLPVTRA